MAVKLVVIYPLPGDVEAFETAYNRDHVPMAVEKLAGKTKIVSTRVLGPPGRGNRPSTASLRFISHRWRPSNNVRLLKAANRRLGMQFRFHLAAHQSFW
jgi:hypothetical protein